SRDDLGLEDVNLMASNFMDRLGFAHLLCIRAGFRKKMDTLYQATGFSSGFNKTFLIMDFINQHFLCWLLRVSKLSNPRTRIKTQRDFTHLYTSYFGTARLWDVKNKSECPR